MKEESEELVVVFKNLWRTENFLKHWRKTKQVFLLKALKIIIIQEAIVQLTINLKKKKLFQIILNLYIYICIEKESEEKQREVKIIQLEENYNNNLVQLPDQFKADQVTACC